MSELPQDLVNHLRHLYPKDPLICKYDNFDTFINYLNSIYSEMVERYREEKAQEMIMEYFEKDGAFLRSAEEVESYLLGRPYKRGEGEQPIFRDKKGMGIPITGEFARAMRYSAGLGYPSKEEKRYMTKAEIAALPYEYRVSCVKDGQEFVFTEKTEQEARELAQTLRAYGAKDVRIYQVPK